MDLNHFRITQPGTGLIAAGSRASGADHRHRALAVHHPATAGRHHDRISTKWLDLHRPHVLCDDSLTYTAFIEYRPEELPELILFDFAVCLETAGLLIERVEKLLTGGRAGKVGAFEE